MLRWRRPAPAEPAQALAQASAASGVSKRSVGSPCGGVASRAECCPGRERHRRRRATRSGQAAVLKTLRAAVQGPRAWRAQGAQRPGTGRPGVPQAAAASVCGLWCRLRDRGGGVGSESAAWAAGSVIEPGSELINARTRVQEPEAGRSGRHVADAVDAIAGLLEPAIRREEILASCCWSTSGERHCRNPLHAHTQRATARFEGALEATASGWRTWASSG